MRDPTRRSRNIGTSKQGHGADNRLVIPFRTHPEAAIFVENLGHYTTEKRTIGRNALIFVTGKPRPSCSHACSIEDMVRVLSLIPPDDLYLLDLIVLRQPKRKEEVLSGAWGRYYPFINIKNLSGSAIILESLDIRKPLRWKKPLEAEALHRLERLKSQGHSVVESPRFFDIFSTLDAVRETQLYETLPHEIGHHLHSLTDVNYGQRTKREKEEFAEKYAREFIEKWGDALR